MKRKLILINKEFREKLKNSNTCRIIHTKTGLFFNGYEKNFPTQKNTLSPTNFQSFITLENDKEVILKNYFRNQKKVYIYVKYKGSLVHKELSKHYEDYSLLPLSEFHIEFI